MLDLMCEPPPGGGRLTSLARRGRAKRTLPGRFSGPTVYQVLLSGPSVILPDDHKQALCTAPNARPLSSVVVGKCKLNQIDAVAAQLMHNHPSADPTPRVAVHHSKMPPTMSLMGQKRLLKHVRVGGSFRRKQPLRPSE